MRWAAAGSGAGDGGRAEVEDVMSGPEFQYPRSLAERVGERVGETLEDLVDRLPGVDAPSGTFTGGVGSLVGWLLVVLALAAVVAVVVVVVRRWAPRVATAPTGPSAVELEHRRAAGEWAEEAEALEAAGDWKRAVRARYRELVRTLVDRAQVEDLPGRTPRELCGDMARTTPGATEDFAAATELFELPWYADEPIGAEGHARFRAHAARVLDATAQRRLDRGVEVSPARVAADVGAGGGGGGGQ